ncbi:amidohydrolase [Amycolatopsis sp. K13G38]|uniref:Amidohydrolase n=1 Tax=Amycolatopsis acididurans TaxID=2724524 RepID=A0ABX1IVB6_9PSEU|nr:amidohydrolase family protein [Amycolatopsis acididurans]NKQ51423.1 amidohydrolase [Amycolatopsis acididurans]
MSAPALTGTIDTDVHCGPASLRELLPHLDSYWRNYLTESGLALSPSQDGAYPPNAATSGGPLPHTLAELPPGTSILNCTTSFACNRNPYYEAALTRAVNDWLVSEWLDADERLRGSMVVPTLDAGAAAAEIDRIGDHPRIVQVLVPVRMDAPWGNRRHRPLLRAAAEHDLVLGLHAWGRLGNAPTSSGITHTYLEDYLANSQILAQAQLTSLVTEGVFRDLPDLRVALPECGFSWLPTLLWRFDKDWKAVWREVPWLDRKPSEVVREHVRLTTSPAHLPRDPAQVRQALDLLGAGSMLMYASDHPHDHGPGARRLLEALTEPERDAVLAGNAARWYRI